MSPMSVQGLTEVLESEEEKLEPGAAELLLLPESVLSLRPLQGGCAPRPALLLPQPGH